MYREVRHNILLPLSLFLITVITRIPFTSKLLYHIDSGHFALALEKYDITVHQPHPPGYFLYVMLGRLFHIFIDDTNTVFVSISIIFSGLTVMVIYYLGKEIYDRKIGLTAAAFALTSTNLWLHGEVALTYIAEAFFSAAMALICWKIYKGEHKYIWLSVIILGIAGGIRQNTTVFLFPLWLFSVKGIQVKKILLSIGLLGLVCLLWFVPMVYMTGGWNAYRDAFKELWLFNTGQVSVFENGWASFKIFSSALFKFTFYGIGSGSFVISLSVYSLFMEKRVKSIDKNKVCFFTLWLLPSVMFYLLIFIHPSNPGYGLIFMPALYVFTAVSIQYINGELKKIAAKDIFILIASILIIVNICLFFLLKSPVSYREIRNHDRDLSIMLANIKTFNPFKTAVFVRNSVFFGYRHIMYYLPEYRVYQVDVSIAPTGEMRKTFWGVNKNTFLTDEIIIPKSTENFMLVFFLDGQDKIAKIKNISIKKLQPTALYIASGPLILIKEIYPELKIRFQDS
jgi:hypothetical protein